MKSLGAISSMSDMLQAPAPVLKMLNEMKRLHDIVVAKEDANTDAIAERGVRRIFTSTHSMEVKRSLYGARSVSTLSNELHPPKILAIDSQASNDTQTAGPHCPLRPYRSPPHSFRSDSSFAAIREGDRTDEG